MRKWMFLFVVALLTACSEDMAELDALNALGSNANILGTWVEDEYRGDTLFLDRSGELENENYGFIIGEDGSFTERKNAGWCATPPITLENFEGTWEAVSDSLLDITVAYWGGMMTYQIRVISVDEEALSIKYLYTDDREETR